MVVVLLIRMMTKDRKVKRNANTSVSPCDSSMSSGRKRELQVSKPMRFMPRGK